MTVLEGLTALADHIPAFLLVLARVSGLLVAAPILGVPNAPFGAKALWGLALAVLLFPAAGPLPSGIAGPLYSLLLAKEMLVGLTLGFFTTIFLEAVRFAGDTIGRAAGFSAAEVFNPDAGTMAGPLGDFFFIAAALLFLLLDGHLELLAALQRSFHLVPVGAFTLGPWVLGACITGIQQVFVIALTLALPLEGALLAITVAEGVIARAVPQINILHITFAAKILAVLGLLVIALPAAVVFMAGVVAALQHFIFGLLRAMGT